VPCDKLLLLFVKIPLNGIILPWQPHLKAKVPAVAILSYFYTSVGVKQ
jgi:hypothetical protein